MPTLTDTEFARQFRERRFAPADEKREMERNVQMHVLDPGRVQQFQHNLPSNMAEAMAWYGEIQKAAQMVGRTQRPELRTDRKALTADPVNVWTDIPGTIPRVNRIHPRTLKAMAVSNPIIQSILQNKKARMIRHAKEARGGLQAALEGAEGFDIVPQAGFKNRWDELSPHEEIERKAIISFILNSGDTPRFTSDGRPNRDDLSRESFSQMLAHWVEQRYVYDAVAIEIVRTLNGRRLSGLYAVPGETIVRTDDRHWPYQDTRESKLNPTARYAQVWNGRIYTTFGSNELYYDYANPQTALGMRGYGLSEVEMSVKLTTAILNVIATNNALFDRSALPPGMLLLFGQLNSNQLTEFTDEYNAYRYGAGGQWGLPAMNITDPQGKAEYLRMDGVPDDMTFSSYTSFSAAVLCALFQTDITEINAVNFGGSQSNLSSDKGMAARQTDTRNRSFLPDMDRVSTMYNEILAPILRDRWRFTWTGLIQEDPKEVWARIIPTSSYDEIRILNGQPPVKGLLGSLPAASPALTQMILASLKDGAVTISKDGEIKPAGEFSAADDGAPPPETDDKKAKPLPAGEKAKEAE